MSQHITNNYFQHFLKNDSQRRIKTLNSINDTNSTKIKKVIIPKNICIDKETLYEQLYHEKLRSKKLSVENQQLIGVLSQLESNINIMDQTDQRKMLSQSFLKIKQQDQEIQTLKESIQYKVQVELKRQIQDLQTQLFKYQLSSKFEGDQYQLIEDNVSLLNKLESQKQYIIDLEKTRSEYILIKAKFNQLQQVLKLKEQQIQRFRDRDPLSEMNLLRNPTKNENLLMNELNVKKDEIQLLTYKLDQSQTMIQVTQNALTQLNQESKHKIQILENEKRILIERLEKLQLDYNSILEKQKQMDKYLSQFQKKKIQTSPFVYGEDSLFQSATQLPLSPTATSNDQLIVKQVRKQQIEQIVLELKLSLRKKRITLQEAETILFSNESEISINEIEKKLKEDPFTIKNSTLLARYLVEDYSEKEFVYDPDLKVPQAQVKSIFKNLLQNYTLIFDDQVIETVKIFIKHYLQDYCQKKSLSIINQDSIIDCMQLYEVKWNGKHSDYLQQEYYNKYSKCQEYEINNLLRLFEDQQ
ncbi:unnamed protein product [Paramecium pentaurelia]|uniref:Uncharacterized protein n=1 Tax=Paramecium pentaurelia TaxID=43138 RepID=A0A8S1T7K4_9CILI|nr:unnamed protein product [Paramecium pentaurelia]